MLPAARTAAQRVEALWIFKFHSSRFLSFATHFLLCPPLFLRFERYSNRPPIYLRDFENAPELSAIRRRKNFGKFPSFEEGNWFTNVGFVFSPLERSEARGKWSVIVLRFYSLYKAGGINYILDAEPLRIGFSLIFDDALTSHDHRLPPPVCSALRTRDRKQRTPVGGRGGFKLKNPPRISMFSRLNGGGSRYFPWELDGCPVRKPELALNIIIALEEKKRKNDRCTMIREFSFFLSYISRGREKKEVEEEEEEEECFGRLGPR